MCGALLVQGMCVKYAGRYAPCIALYPRGCKGELCLLEVLEVLEVLEAM